MPIFDSTIVDLSSYRAPYKIGDLNIKLNISITSVFIVF
jgi:hypothetical protein